MQCCLSANMDIFAHIDCAARWLDHLRAKKVNKTQSCCGKCRNVPTFQAQLIKLGVCKDFADAGPQSDQKSVDDAIVSFKPNVVAAKQPEKKKVSEDDESVQTINLDVKSTNEDSDKLFCTCKQLYQEGVFMIECATCKAWFHPSCVSLSMTDAKRKKKFKCPPCRGEARAAREEQKEPAITLREGVAFLSPTDFPNLNHNIKAFSPKCQHCRCSQVAPARFERQENITLSRMVKVQAGDFPWLLACVGGQTATSTYYCFSCKTTCRDLKAGIPHVCHVTPTAAEKALLATFPGQTDLNPEPRTQRENFEDAKRYAAQKTKDATKTNSILRTPIFDVVLDLQRFIAKAPLHVVLGLGKKLIELYEEIAKDLDASVKLLRAEVALGTEEARDTFSEEGKFVRKEEPRLKLMRIYQKLAMAENDRKEKRGTLAKAQAALKKQEAEIKAEEAASEKKQRVGTSAYATASKKDRLAFLRSKLKVLIVDVKEAKKEVEKFGTKKALEAQTLLDKELAQADGPFKRKLESARKRSGWSRESYHGGSITGNGIHAMLKGRFHLWNCFQAINVIAPDGKQYIFESSEMERKLHILLNKFDYMRTLFARNDPLCKHEVLLLERRAIDWAISYARSLPDVKPLPKSHLVMHLSESATLLAEEGISPGMNTEAPVESSHVDTNKLDKQFVPREIKAKRWSGCSTAWLHPEVPQCQPCEEKSCDAAESVSCQFPRT